MSDQADGANGAVKCDCGWHGPIGDVVSGELCPQCGSAYGLSPLDAPSSVPLGFAAEQEPSKWEQADLRRRRGHTAIPNELFQLVRDGRLTPQAFLVAAKLLEWCRPRETVVRKPQRDFAEALNKTQPWVSKQMQLLQAAGLVSVRHRYTANGSYDWSEYDISALLNLKP